MDTESEPDITQYLQRLKAGDRSAHQELFPIIYDELRRIARSQTRKQSSGLLQTTALVNEAFIKLSAASSQDWKDRIHFFSVAATAMRQILVDQARKINTSKRGRGWQKVDFENIELSVNEQSQIIIDIDNALNKLASSNPRLAKIIECKFFSSMTIQQSAEALGITERTIQRDWIKAKAWLHRELQEDI